MSVRSFLATLAALVFMTFAPQAAQADGYVIGAGDEVDLFVFARPEFSRNYRVRSDGTLSLHLIGPVRAEGLTPQALEDAIELRFDEVFDSPSSVTLEVSRYRPIILGGDVAQAGRIEFHPGLDARAALALAGGLLQFSAELGSESNAMMRVQAEAARYALLKTRLAAALARQARLQTEQDSALLPPDPAQLETLDHTERVLLERRADQLQLRITSEQEQADLAIGEVDAFAERRRLIRQQLDATMEALDRQDKLVKSGLARADRLLDLRISADQFRADELEAVALEAAARQKIALATSSKDSALSEHLTDVASTLATLERQISEIRTEMASALQFVERFGGAGLLEGSVESDIVYTLRRRSEGTLVVSEIPADALLMPGDMLEVKRVDRSAVEDAGAEAE